MLMATKFIDRNCPRSPVLAMNPDMNEITDDSMKIRLFFTCTPTPSSSSVICGDPEVDIWLKRSTTKVDVY